MNSNRKFRKKLAAATALCVSASMVATPVFAAGNLYKDESVYVNADASGKVEQITVSDWIQNPDGEKSFTDLSDLKEIKNIKGNEKFTQKGDDVSWKANGKDIYYQGETKKQLPVTVKVIYELDGKEMDPKDMLGKSGHMKMTVKYTNHTSETVTVAGEKVQMHVPFMMFTTGYLPVDNFSNVEINHGKIVSDSQRIFMAGASLPGLSESLDLPEDSELDIPEDLIVEADVKDFEMCPLLTIGSANAFNKLNLDKIDDLDDLKENMDKLTDASLKLVEGSEKLSNGLKELDDKSGTLTEGVNKLANGASTLDDGATKLGAGSRELNKGATDLNTGVASLKSGTNELQNNMPKMLAGITNLNNGAEKMNLGLKEYVPGAKMLADKTLGLIGEMSTVESKAQNNFNMVNAKYQIVMGMLTSTADLEELKKNPGNVEEQTKMGLLQASQILVGGLKQAQNTITANEQELSVVEGQINTSMGHIEALSKEAGMSVKAAAESTGVAATALSRGIDSEGIPSAIQSAGILAQTAGKNAEAIKNANISAQSQIDSVNNTITSINEKAGEVNTARDALSNSVADVNSKIDAHNNAVQAKKEAIKQKLIDSGLEEAKADEIVSDIDSLSMSGVNVTIPKQLNVNIEQVTNPYTDLQKTLSEDTNKYYDEAKNIGTSAAFAGKQLGEAKNNLENVQKKSSEAKKAQAGLKQTVDKVKKNKQLELKQSKEQLHALELVAEGINNKATDGKSQLENSKQKFDTAFSGYMKKYQEMKAEMEKDEIEKKLQKLSDSSQTVLDGSAQLVGGTSLLMKKSDELSKGVGALNAGAGKLLDGSGKLSGGTKNLVDGLATLKGGTVQLKSGTAELKNGSSKLVDGVHQLNNGGKELADGMKKFNDEGIKKISDFTEGDVEKVLERMKSLKDLSEEYTNYSGIADDMEGEVKFIIETAPIEEKK